MNTNEKNIDFQIQLWALVGPLIALATVATLFFQGSSHNLYLSWTLFAGLLLCWKWKVQGMFAALGLLLLSLGYHYLDVPDSERVWHVGVATAIAMTFFVTAISYEEIERLILGMEKESSSRLKSLLQLDEKLETVQSLLEKERAALSDKLKEEQLKIESYERLIEVTREEILTTHETQEKLLQELFEKRHELARLQEQPQQSGEIEALRFQLERAQSEASQFHNELELIKNSPVADPAKRSFEALYKQLRQQFEDKSHLLDQTRKELFHAMERAAAVEREQHERTLDRSDMERGLERCIVELEQERDQLAKEVESLYALLDQ